MHTAAALPHAPAPSGDELLALARAGSDGAFAALVREHQAMVFGWVHFLQSRGHSRELAQECSSRSIRICRVSSPRGIWCSGSGRDE